jgi:transcriptional regulator with XRE-family HTH domain
MINMDNQNKKKILQILGYLIRQKRTELNISQDELGARSNLDRTYISGVERGLRNPSFTAIFNIASGLDITVSQLLENLEIEIKKIRE